MSVRDPPSPCLAFTLKKRPSLHPYWSCRLPRIHVGHACFADGKRCVFQRNRSNLLRYDYRSCGSFREWLRYACSGIAQQIFTPVRYQSDDKVHSIEVCMDYVEYNIACNPVVYFCNNGLPLGHSQMHRSNVLERFSEEGGTKIQPRTVIPGTSGFPLEYMHSALSPPRMECMHVYHTFLSLSSSDVSTPKRAAKGRSTSMRDCCALSPSCATQRLCTSTTRHRAPK